MLIRGHRYPAFLGAPRVLSGGTENQSTIAQADPLPIGQSSGLSVDPLRRVNVALPGDRYTMAEEGAYFLASSWTMNPPALVACTFPLAQTAFSATTPNFLIQNNSATALGNSYSVAIDFLKMVATAAATGTTAIYYACVLDPAAIRTPTTNNMTTALLNDPNGNYAALQNFGPPAAANLPVVRFQSSATASVLPAASATAFLAARGALGGLNIVGDEMLIAFGDMGVGAQTATTAVEGAGQPGRRVSCDGPIEIPPGGSLAIHIWMPGSTASFNPEFTMGLFARS